MVSRGSGSNFVSLRRPFDLKNRWIFFRNSKQEIRKSSAIFANMFLSITFVDIKSFFSIDPGNTRFKFDLFRVRQTFFGFQRFSLVSHLFLSKRILIFFDWKFSFFSTHNVTIFEAWFGNLASNWLFGNPQTDCFPEIFQHFAYTFQQL